MSSPSSKHIAGMNRREFVQVAMMMAALAKGSEHALLAADDAPRAIPFAALQPLAPGAVRPEGWLRVYLEKQAAELGSQLPQVSWPFTEPYWQGKEQAESWWPWEQKAYWIDGATRLALVLNDEHLLRQACTSIAYTLAHAGPDGYLGPTKFESPRGDFHRWPQMIFFRALAAAADARPEMRKQIVEAMRKHYVNDTAPYGTAERDVTNIETMLWCYRHTGDPRLLAMAEKAWAGYLTVAASPEFGDLSEMRVYAATPINAHGVTYAETAKQPAILYAYTGKQEYLKFALAAQRRIFDHHMLIDGVPSTSEWFRTRTSLDSHETCDISDHTWSWGHLLMVTGDSDWADRIERACLNAGPGAVRNNWKALQYFSCPNQFLATMHSDHNVMEHGGSMMAYQPNPGRHTACCGGNVHRMMPNYVIRMWMQTADCGLAATLYGPSRVRARVGQQQTPVEIEQTTDYPFGEGIRFSFRGGHAAEFPLLLRIPAWCGEPRVAVNGIRIPAPVAGNGFVTVRRRFSPGDTVSLTLPMQTAISRWPQSGIGIEHGPLVFSLPIQERWEPVSDPKYATAAFPAWNATAVSAWNYGVNSSSDLANQIRVQRKPMTDDPWSDPPVTLIAPLRKIEDWTLQRDVKDTDQLFTPPLPELSMSKVSSKVELVALTPYGCTQLRVTIFPEIVRVEDPSAKEPV